MKVKLLKKLRNRFYIAGRNGMFRLFDSRAEKGQPDDYCSGSKWMSKEDVIKKRRKKILKAAQCYLQYKPNKK